MSCRECKWFDDQTKIGRAGCCDAPVPIAVRYHDKFVMMPTDGKDCPCFTPTQPTDGARNETR